MQTERKYQIAIIVLCFLIIVLLVKGCNKNLEINSLEKRIVTQDSIINVKNEALKEKNYELKLSETKEFEAKKRVEDMQNIVEKIKNNTTITIEAPENKEK